MHSKNALDALQWVIITGRSMGYEGRDPKDIANLLDEAEYLVSLILRGTPQEFSEHLDHIANKFPMCKYAVHKYRQAESSAAVEQAA